MGTVPRGITVIDGFVGGAGNASVIGGVVMMTAVVVVCVVLAVWRVFTCAVLSGLHHPIGATLT